MTRFKTTMKVMLGSKHLSQGRTRHEQSGPQGVEPFPPFVRLEIAEYPGDSGYYLLHICADGQMADTHHESLEEAIHQAEWELGVQPNEWEAVQAD